MTGDPYRRAPISAEYAKGLPPSVLPPPMSTAERDSHTHELLDKLDAALEREALYSPPPRPKFIYTVFILSVAMHPTAWPMVEVGIRHKMNLLGIPIQELWPNILFNALHINLMIRREDNGFFENPVCDTLIQLFAHCTPLDISWQSREL